MWAFCLYVCVYNMCIQCIQKPEEGIGSPGTVVTDVCEPPGLLAEQQCS